MTEPVASESFASQKEISSHCGSLPFFLETWPSTSQLCLSCPGTSSLKTIQPALCFFFCKLSAFGACHCLDSAATLAAAAGKVAMLHGLNDDASP